MSPRSTTIIDGNRLTHLVVNEMMIRMHLQLLNLLSHTVNSKAIEDSGDRDKLGQLFTSADPLEKVDIGDGTIPRQTFVNKNLSAEYKADLVNLLKRIHRLFCL